MYQCSCQLINGLPCSQFFKKNEILEIRQMYASLDKEQLDLVLLGKISCGIHVSPETMFARRINSPRKSTRTDFYHEGRRICKDVFLHLHGISKNRFA